MRKPTILVCADYYLPGCKAGGALRTLLNTVEALGGEFDFRVLTRDRDISDSEPYGSASEGEWLRVGKAQVAYLAPNELRPSALRRCIAGCEHDLLFLNSALSGPFTVLPLILRRLGFLDEPSVIVAPRGEFSRSALDQKKLKKAVFLPVARAVGLYRGVRWLASCEDEAEQIRRAVGGDADIAVAPDPVAFASGNPERDSSTKKDSGHLRACFLSRICRMKNLKGALDVLATMEAERGTVEFDIYGPKEDRRYWKECEDVIGSLPPNVKARYCGAIGLTEVRGILETYHLLFLPTMGENFGHVIVESLSAGCPVLISDRTQWNDLGEQGAGWVVPLEDGGGFRTALVEALALDGGKHAAYSACAREYASGIARRLDAVGRNRRCIEECLGAAGREGST